MHKGKCLGIACLFFASIAVAFPTKAANQLWEEYDKLISKREAVGTLGPDLFGDQLSFYTGSLSFTQTDVSLPGNSSLPVAITRNLSIESHGSGGNPHNDSPMGDWDLDLPSISGTFATSQGWVGANGSASSRCSQPAAPAGHVFGPYNDMDATEYWHGYHMRLPGGGGGELLGASKSGGEILASATGRTRPGSGGPYYWLTSDWTYVSCLPTLANAPTQGEGFMAITADGTKYWFNWMATFYEDQLKEKRKAPSTGDDVLNRQRLALYATRVEDRFGNSVTYTYTNASNAPVRLSRIDASDGRSLVLESNAYGQVTKVTAGAQQWTYEYQSVGSVIPVLTAVVQPDLSRWAFNVAGLSGRLHYEHAVPGEPSRSCTDPGAVIEASYTGTITHPSGAVGEFTVGTTRFGRSNVLLMCKNVDVHWTTPNDPSDDVAHYPINWDSLALTRKRIYGPGLVTAEWNYGYGSDISWFTSGGGSEELPVCTYGDCIQPQCVSDACAGSSVTSVTGPGSTFQRYTFGNSYRYNEGKLLKVERGSGPDNILSTQQTTYELASSGQVFPTPIGVSPQIRSGGAFAAEYLRPQRSTTTVQQGVTFNSLIDLSDKFARPLRFRKWSSLGHGKTDRTDYYDDESKWVLGQVRRQYNGNTTVVMSETYYDPATALPQWSKAFGKLQSTFGYYADGTLRSVTDGRNNTTTLSNWERGVPKNIQHPDGTTESATVNGAGWITSATNEVGSVTGYGYDAMGRVASIVYPTGDTPAYNSTSIVFQPVAADEYGIPAGHWRRTEQTGNSRKLTYFDAMWRPIVEEVVDIANMAATNSWVTRHYDAAGRASFVSYPRNLFQSGWVAWSSVTNGTHTTYDALDRPVRVEQDSELGRLASTAEYISGFKTLSTNPRGYQSVSEYQVYDQPATDAPILITTPEGTVTEIHRHPYLSRVEDIKRRSADGSLSATRQYVYDGFQQVCKTIEPETGATVMDYDTGGNLQWSAAGLVLPNTLNCDTIAGRDSGRKVTRYYDARNRLTTLQFPDQLGNQTWAYTPDGLPSQITTLNESGVNVINAYSYNKRRLLTGETVGQAGWYTWGLGYAYDANANLTGQTYPSNLYVDYAPNALGQPTRAGKWATGVSYYPNGAIKQFTYGNGLTHNMTQNARQLPARMTDGGNALDFDYGFDANGNVDHIYDYVTGTPTAQHRLMQYDGLDRLTATGSAMFYGDHWMRYTYDALDNQTSSTLAGVKEHNYVYDTARNRLSLVRNNAGAATVALEYDVQGNLSVKNGQTYSFDYGNRLRAVSGKEGYRYDGHGRRVMAWSPSFGNILSHYSQSGQLLYQSDERKTTTNEHVYLGGSLVGTQEYNWGLNELKTKYQHTDALGTPVAVTNEAGQVVDRMNYQPYGRAINKFVNGVGYTGHVFDAETGLNYMQQRYYDPTLGRFLSVDPVTADSNTGGNFNRYWYANNNPYKFTDPDGRFGVVGALIGGGIEFGLQMATAKGSFSQRFAQVDGTDVLVAAGVGAITGGIGGRLATKAAQGAMRAGTAVKQTAKAGAAASAIGAGAKDAANKKMPSATGMVVSGAVGLVASGVGARIGTSTAATFERMSRSSAPGVSNTAFTTIGSMRTSEMATSTSQAVGQVAVDATAAGLDKAAEAKVRKQ